MPRKRKKGKKNKGLWSKRSDYTCLDGTIVSMDSTWETACAKKLDELKIKWVRDPNMKIEYRTQRLRLRNYIPDFYLPEYDIYVEVKGYWTDAAKWKMKDVMQRNPGKILILDSLEMIDNISLPISHTTGSII